MGRQADVLISFGIDESSFSKMSKETKDRLEKITETLSDKNVKTNYTKFLSQIVTEFSKAGDDIENVAKKFIERFEYLEKLRSRPSMSNMFRFFDQKDIDRVLKDFDLITEKQREYNKLTSESARQQTKSETTMNLDKVIEKYNLTSEKITEYLSQLQLFQKMNLSGVKIEAKDLQQYALLIDYYKQLNSLKAEENSLDNVYKQQSLLSIRQEMEALEAKYNYQTSKGTTKSYLKNTLKGVGLGDVKEINSYISNVNSAVSTMLQSTASQIKKEYEVMEQSAEKTALKIYNLRSKGFTDNIPNYDSMIDVGETLQKYIVDLDTAKQKIAELNSVTNNDPYIKQKENYNDLIAYIQRYISLGGQLKDLQISQTANKIFNDANNDYLTSIKTQVDQLKNVQKVIYGVGIGAGGTTGTGIGTGFGEGTGTGFGTGVGGLSEDQLKSLLTILEEIKTSIEGINTTVTQLGNNDSIKNISTSFVNISSSFETLKNSLGNDGSFTTAVNGFSEAITRVTDALSRIDSSSQEIERLKSQIQGLSSAFEELKTKEEAANVSLYQNFQPNNQTVSSTNVANIAQDMVVSLEAAGASGQEAGNVISTSQEEIQKKIEETIKSIEREKKELQSLDNIINGNISYKNKSEATDALRHFYNEINNKEKNNEQISTRLIATYVNVRNAAEKLGVAQSSLDRYFNATAIGGYQRAIDNLNTSYEVTRQVIENLELELTKLQSKTEFSESSQKHTEVTKQETKSINEESNALTTLAQKLEYLKQLRSDSKFLGTAEDKRIDWEEKAYDVGGNNPKSEQDSLNKIRKYEELCEHIESANRLLDEFEEKYEKVILTTSGKNRKKIEILSVDDLDGLTLTENKIKDIQLVARISEEEIQNIFSLFRDFDNWSRNYVDSQLSPPTVRFTSTTQDIQLAIDKLTEYRDKMYSALDSDAYSVLSGARQSEFGNTVTWLETLISTEEKLLQTSIKLDNQSKQQKLFEGSDGQLSFIEQTTTALKREEEQALKTKDALAQSQIPGQITLDEYLASKPLQVQQPAQIQVTPIVNPEEFASQVTSQLSGVKSEINVSPKVSVDSSAVTTGNIDKALGRLGSESKALTNIKTKIETVTKRIGSKTAAFNNEADTVDKVVNKEASKLGELSTSISGVTNSLKEQSATFIEQGNNVKGVLSDIAKSLENIKANSKFTISINNKVSDTGNISNTQNTTTQNVINSISSTNAKSNSSTSKSKIDNEDIIRLLNAQLSSYKEIWKIKNDIFRLDEKERINNGLTQTDLKRKEELQQQLETSKSQFEKYSELLRINNISLQQAKELNNLDKIRTNALERQKQIVESIINSSRKSKENKLTGFSNQIDKLQSESNLDKYTESYKNSLLTIQNVISSLRSKDIDLVTAEEIKDVEKLLNGLKETDKLANKTKVASLAADIQKFLTKNTRLDAQTRGQLENLLVQLNDPSIARNQLQGITQEYQNIEQAAYKAGKMGKNFFDLFNTRLVHQIAQQLSFYFSFRAIIGYVRRAINTIKELDTALVDLRKTARMSSSELDGFYKESNKVAKQMGVTTKEIISQAAAWSRFNNIDLLYGNI